MSSVQIWKWNINKIIYRVLHSKDVSKFALVFTIDLRSQTVFKAWRAMKWKLHNLQSEGFRYTTKIFKCQFHLLFSFIAWCFVDDQSCFFFPKSKKHTEQYISGKSKIQLGCEVTISRAKRFLDNVIFRPGSSKIRILDDLMKFLFFSQHFETPSNTLSEQFLKTLNCIQTVSYRHHTENFDWLVEFVDLISLHSAQNSRIGGLVESLKPTLILFHHVSHFTGWFVGSENHKKMTT